MPGCSRCNSKRILSINAKCSDLFFLSYQGKEYRGYVPNTLGIGGGDYIVIEVCLDCGQMQEDFPVGQKEVNEIFRPK